METTIECPKLEDWEIVNELARQVHKMHVKWRPDLFIDVDEVIVQKDFEVMIQNKEIFVAKVHEKIVGYIMFNIKEKNSAHMRYRKQLSIEAICVDEKYRGNRIGTSLLEYVKMIGKENGCTDMHLTVNEENKKAIQLYEKLGFKVGNISYLMQI